MDRYTSGAVWHEGRKHAYSGEVWAAVLGSAKKRPALWEETCLIPTRRYAQTCSPNKDGIKSQLRAEVDILPGSSLVTAGEDERQALRTRTGSGRVPRDKIAYKPTPRLSALR